MSEETATANGPAEADNRADATVIADEGSNGSGGDWLAGLSEENRNLVQAKQWDSPDALARSYRELAAHASKALRPPAEDAPAEEWSAFYAKLGRPEKPEGYEFQLPEGIPENLPYDDTFAQKFRSWAHEQGLTLKQARALHDAYVQDFAGQMQAAQEAEVQAVEGAHQALVKEWGAPETETYKRKVEMMSRAARQLGGSDLYSELAEMGAITKSGEVKRPQLAKALASVGEKLFAEDALFSGAGSVENPFSEKSHNLTKQGQMIRSDPDRAKALIKAAGLKPSDYGLSERRLSG